MRLSTYSDFSLRVLIHTAVQHPETVTIDEIAEAFAISRNHLVKIVHHLGKLGYLLTRRGTGGGFILGMPPSIIRLGTVVRQMEGSSALVECFDPETNRCRLAPCCRLKGILSEAEGSFFESLDRYTIADLAQGKAKIKTALGL